MIPDNGPENTEKDISNLNGRDNVIKHSKYQSILSNRKTKFSVKNIEKNKDQG